MSGKWEQLSAPERKVNATERKVNVTERKMGATERCPPCINVNEGQNKFEVHISKTMAKIANFQPKIGQDATFTQTLNGHNSALSYPILTLDHTKMTSSAGQTEVKIKLSFILTF